MVPSVFMWNRLGRHKNVAERRKGLSTKVSEIEIVSRIYGISILPVPDPVGSVIVSSQRHNVLVAVD